MSNNNCCLSQCAISTTAKHAGTKLFQIITRKKIIQNGKRTLQIQLANTFREHVTTDKVIYVRDTFLRKT